MSPNRGLGSLCLAIVCASFCAAAPASAQIPPNAPAGAYSLKIFSYREIPFRTTVRQQYDYSCGSAALATLLRYHYGRDVAEAEIFKAMFLTGDQRKIRQVGFSLLDMKQYLAKNGFAADGYRLTLDDLQEMSVPAITLITVGTYKHFVVIKGIRDGRVMVGDPALGLKIYRRVAFEAMWNGIVFLIHDATIKAAFNRDEEWNRWARAPVSEKLDSQSLFGIAEYQPNVYQVMQLTAMQPLP